MKNFLNFLRPSREKLQKALDLKLVGGLTIKKIPTWSQFKQVGKFLTAAEKKLLAALLIIILAGLASFSAETILRHRTIVPASGGEYIEGAVGFPSAINPLFAPLNPVDADLSRLVYAGLLKYDNALNLTPDLADKFAIEQGGRTYRVFLKSDLKWQDGEPLTADDVAFTLDLIQNPEAGSPLLPSFQKVQFKKISDLEFTLELEQPFVSFNHLLTTGLLPAHLWQEVAPANLKLSASNLKPIGAGPFMFASLSKDSRGNLKSYTLKVNPYYQGKKPFLKQITFKFFPDSANALEALRNRQIQGLSFLPKEQKEKINKKSLNVLSLRLSQYTALFFNQKTNLLLKSAVLRQALSLAIDREQIIKQALKGEGLAAFGPFPPGSLGFSSDFKYAPAPAQANLSLDNDKWKKISREDFLEKRKQELYNTWLEQQKALTPNLAKPKPSAEEQEKFKKDKEDFLRRTVEELASSLSPTQTSFREKNNYGLTITLTALNQPEFSQTAALLKDWWQELGAQVTLNLVDGNQIREIIKDRSYEILLYGVVAGPESDPFPLWHSSQLFSPGLNLAGYGNRQSDELLEKARQNLVPTERQKLYLQFQKMLVNDRPAIFLYYPAYLYPLDSAIKGVELTRLYHPADRFNNIADWYLQTKSGWR